MQNLPSLCPEQKEPNIFLGKTDIISYQSKNLDENNINHTEEVVTRSEQGTTFPAKIGTTMCNALIDTGATRSCISKKYYKKLQLANIHLLQNVNVKSATSSNLTRPLILGRDFLTQNHVSVRYSENGKCILDYQQQELIASLNVENKPQLSLANSMTLPGRTLAIIHVNNNLKPEQNGQMYEIKPNYFLTEE